MTKDVAVTIEGIQPGVPQDKIITKTSGSYHRRNGNHYIQYEEVSPDGAAAVKNIIRIAPGQIDIMKNGTNGTHLIFIPGKTTDSIYQTPYGSLSLKISTDRIKISEDAGEIRAALSYTLSSNGSVISENSLDIRITSLNY